MSRHLNSEEIMGKIPSDTGCGIEFEVTGFDDETYGPAVTYCHGFPRTVRMDLRSYVGISPGAVHTYCQMRWYGLYIRKPDGTDHPRAGYSNIGLPKPAQDTDIEVRRPVSKRDIEYAKDRGDGWVPKYGDYTHDFWSYEDALNAGLTLFRTAFGPGWQLEYNDQETGDLITELSPGTDLP